MSELSNATDRLPRWPTITDAMRTQRPLTESEQQQAWWDSMTDEQREDYEDRMERDRLERYVYGRTLTEAGRAQVLATGSNDFITDRA